ncbi:MAG: tRNA (adenosine(37)-N6)-threonylcarbamoyltransferase complex ATPase subunit type 1 TsaE [Anaerolineaceae bacterium]|nr:tRNA (adenosine(37)-N6)-threonylcarbamoyltransferase complex ATPase subunit type 1 TsaE [Anaerolineaceae bacterium]
MPILNPNTVECISRGAAQTRRFGMRLGGLLRPGDFVGLSGDLGAGKTTLISGVAKGWGSPDPVTSPTFVLVNEYYRNDGGVLFHMDAYRIGSIWEAEELDFERMLQKGPMLVEWAEQIEPILPKERLWIRMNYISEDIRSFTLQPSGKRYEALTAEFRRQCFGV